MKKLLAISFLVIFATANFTLARVQYDSTGRKILVDDTIRGRKRAAQVKYENSRKMQAAAAARINYEQELKKLENQETNLKHNYYSKKK